MPFLVADGMSTLSTPIPKRLMIRQRDNCGIISAVTFPYVVSTASASLATCKIASGSVPLASNKSASIFSSTALTGSRFGNTESVTATSLRAMLFFEGLFHVLHQRENYRPLAGHQDIFFKPSGLLEAGMPGKGLDSEAHVFLNFRGKFQGIGT